MESRKGNMVSLQTFKTYENNNNETNNVVMKQIILNT